MKIKQVLLICICSYFNPLTIYWFNFAYQGITDLIIGCITSFLVTLFLLCIFSSRRIFKKKLVTLSLAFGTSAFGCTLVWTAHSLEAGLGPIGYALRENFKLVNYLFIMTIMPTFWINLFCFYIQYNIVQKEV